MTTASTSTWSPLRHPPFRGLWATGTVYFIGNAMQTMAAAWLMIELTGSSLLAALVQTAVFLPMFLLALPAGALADRPDRRKLIVRGLATQVAIALLLAALVIAGWAGPGVLLFFIFVSGCCTALLSPAWNSTIVDAVPRDELPQAITAVAIAFNAARALGPALAGVVFAQTGAGWVFLIAVGCVLAMVIAAFATWQWLVYAALLFGGAAWMATMSTFNTATQTSAPPWVRSRATAMHTLCALGSFAIGSAVWGLVSAVAGLSVTLC